MRNARMHEALMLLFPHAELPGAWGLWCGPETDWDVAIYEWNLPDQRPTQEQLDAAYASLEAAEAAASPNDIPISEVEKLIYEYPTIGWALVNYLGL